MRFLIDLISRFQVFQQKNDQLGDATETVLSTIGSTFRSTSHDSVEKACQDIEAEKEAKKKAISDKVDMVDGKIGEFSEVIPILIIDY